VNGKKQVYRLISIVRFALGLRSDDHDKSVLMNTFKTFRQRNLVWIKRLSGSSDPLPVTVVWHDAVEALTRVPPWWSIKEYMIKIVAGADFSEFQSATATSTLEHSNKRESSEENETIGDSDGEDEEDADKDRESMEGEGSEEALLATSKMSQRRGDVYGDEALLTKDEEKVLESELSSVTDRSSLRKLVNAKRMIRRRVLLSSKSSSKNIIWYSLRDAVKWISGSACKNCRDVDRFSRILLNLVPADTRERVSKMSLSSGKATGCLRFGDLVKLLACVPEDTFTFGRIFHAVLARASPSISLNEDSDASDGGDEFGSRTHNTEKRNPAKTARGSERKGNATSQDNAVSGDKGVSKGRERDTRAGKDADGRVRPIKSKSQSHRHQSHSQPRSRTPSRIPSASSVSQRQRHSDSKFEPIHRPGDHQARMRRGSHLHRQRSVLEQLELFDKLAQSVSQMANVSPVAAEQAEELTQQLLLPLIADRLRVLPPLP